MDRLKLKTNNTITLLNNSFRKISDAEYVYRFPVYKYKSSVLITAIFTVHIDEKTIELEVVDNNTGTLYFPYYNTDNHNNEVRKLVVKKIDLEINNLRKAGIIL